MKGLILLIFLFSGLALMLVDLVFIEKKSISETLITMQFSLPKKPLGIVGNIIAIVSAIFLVLVRLGIF